MVSKVESNGKEQKEKSKRTISFNSCKDMYEDVISYVEGNERKVVCWDGEEKERVGRGRKKIIEKIRYGIGVDEYNKYLHDPSTHSARVFLINATSADFIATVRRFSRDDISYVYDVNKKIYGVIFHDEPRKLWY